MEKVFLIIFIPSAVLEFGICCFTQKSKNSSVWCWVPFIVAAVADFLYCCWVNVQSNLTGPHQQGNCIGIFLYIIVFIYVLIFSWMGLGVGKLFYWVIKPQK